MRWYKELPATPSCTPSKTSDCNSLLRVIILQFFGFFWVKIIVFQHTDSGMLFKVLKPLSLSQTFSHETTASPSMARPSGRCTTFLIPFFSSHFSFFHQPFTHQKSLFHPGFEAWARLLGGAHKSSVLGVSGGHLHTTCLVGLPLIVVISMQYIASIGWQMGTQIVVWFGFVWWKFFFCPSELCFKSPGL